MFQQTKTHLLDRLKTMMSYDGINDKFTTEWINELGGCLVDAYVVGRIFRSFRDGPDPRYIIVYLGYWHTNNIKTLFDSLRFFNVGNNYSNTKDVNFQCLMLGLRVPFFQP